MKLLIGSSNKGKITEINDAFAELSVTLVSPMELNIFDVPEEHGATYQENALVKARFYRERSGLSTLADDSGIIVDALKNELGIHTRRWGAGKDASDAEWIAYFLKRMESETDRAARFMCCIAYIAADGSEHIFEGTCDGVITASPEAPYLPGLPISACFKPNGYDRVFSALTIDEKNAVSHRGRALAACKKFITQEALK